jgi:hypothetical protein
MRSSLGHGWHVKGVNKEREGLNLSITCRLDIGRSQRASRR